MLGSRISPSCLRRKKTPNCMNHLLAIGLTCRVMRLLMERRRSRHRMRFKVNQSKMNLNRLMVLELLWNKVKEMR